MPSPKSVASWVLCRGLGKTLDEMTVTIPHDLYVFGTQENSVCDREWVESLRAMLKEQTELDYKPVREGGRVNTFKSTSCHVGKQEVDYRMLDWTFERCPHHKSLTYAGLTEALITTHIVSPDDNSDFSFTSVGRLMRTEVLHKVFINSNFSPEVGNNPCNP